MQRDMELEQEQEQGQGPPCQECVSTRPAAYCWAWDRYLCEECRRRWTDNATKDGGRHPCGDHCSCETCREARNAARSQVTIGPGGSAP
jgi:hypothetical protein